MKTQIKVENTRFPRLTRAVLRRVDREQLEDVARHGADAGWSGFTYYSDTVAFFKAHKSDILEMAKQDADEQGVDMLEMVQGFRCLGPCASDYSETEISESLYSGRGECSDLIRNAMAWYALETVARELNPEI